MKLGRDQMFIALAFYVFFVGLSLLAYSRQSSSDWRNNSYLLGAVGSMTGPFAGAIARNFQGCCVEWSMKILPYCAAFLAFGLITQFVPLRMGRNEHPLRLTGWCVGLLGWFGGVPFSLAHALG